MEREAIIAVKDDNSLEDTAAQEADQIVKASDETLKASNSEVDAEKARAERAAREYKRKKTLAEKSLLSEDELEDAALAADTSLIELRKQEFYRAAIRAIIISVKLYPRAIKQYVARKGLERNVLVHQLAQAKARLARAEHDRKLAEIRAPIEGVVLGRYELGDRTLTAGQQLLLLGNLEEMEVVSDVLTQDALRLRPGSPVSLEPAAGFEPIPGTVKRIDPAGFPSISSLGIEEQRVNVIVSLEERPEGLGVGYRLQARFFTGSKENALIVPRFSVLQAPDRSYYVLKIAEGSLKKETVRLGLKSDLELEVIEGLTQEDAIAARPDSTLKEGMKVTANR